MHFEHDHSEIKLGRVHYEINLVTWRYEPYIKNSRNDIGTGHCKKISSFEARMPFGWVLFMGTDCLDQMEKKEALVAS